MAKEQKRGNREIKKPKAKKKVEPIAATPIGLSRSLSAQNLTPKKKG